MVQNDSEFQIFLQDYSTVWCVNVVHIVKIGHGEKKKKRKQKENTRKKLQD